MTGKPKIITIEEHYWDRELAGKYAGVEQFRDPEIERRLYDLGELRLKEMDAVGIDVQVISHGAPSAQKLPADVAAAVARGVFGIPTFFVGPEMFFGKDRLDQVEEAVEAAKAAA